MHKNSMPVEKILVDGVGTYDALVECLKVDPEACLSSGEPTEACKACMEKILDHGFTIESWIGYREFMKSYDPALDLREISFKIRIILPVWDRVGNRLLGYFNRETRQWLEKPVIEEPELSVAWIKGNCRFARKS